MNLAKSRTSPKLGIVYDFSPTSLMEGGYGQLIRGISHPPSRLVFWDGESSLLMDWAGCAKHLNATRVCEVGPGTLTIDIRASIAMLAWGAS
jgi:hypothetical protein